MNGRSITDVSDSLTLTRIDPLLDNLLLLLALALLGLLILLTGRLGTNQTASAGLPPDAPRVMGWVLQEPSSEQACW